MKMDELEKLRKLLDRLDEKILELLDERAKLAKRIYSFKQKNRVPVFDVLREDEKIRWVQENVRYFPKDSVSKIFVEIFSGMRKLGGNVRVAYLGPEGSFSHIASKAVFGSVAELIPYNLDEIFLKVQEGEVDYGVIPIENSRDGLVGESLDLLLESRVRIIYEVSIKVSFCFFSNAESLKDVRRIYSHQKAIAQCFRWIKENFKEVELIYTSSTSEGARMAHSDREGGAIASEEIRKLMEFKIFVKNVQDFPGERTDFAVIASDELSGPSSARHLVRGNAMRVSFCFSVMDEPGALFRVLRPIARRKINMKKIHSRPDKITRRYNFFVEIEAPPDRKTIERTFEDIKKNTVFFKIFGEYPYRVI